MYIDTPALLLRHGNGRIRDHLGLLLVDAGLLDDGRHVHLLLLVDLRHVQDLLLRHGGVRLHNHLAQSAAKRLGQGSELAAAALPHRGEGPQEPLGAAALRSQPLASAVGSSLPAAKSRSAAMEHRRRRE